MQILMPTKVIFDTNLCLIGRELDSHLVTTFKPSYIQDLLI